MNQYLLVTADTMYKLEVAVNNHLEKGWVVQGGVAAYSGGFIQAVVHPAPVDNTTE